jgi:crotonobetainyl-CoA:carnitine CoA-transferase CaiB-like acyl-CoA transferase
MMIHIAKGWRMQRLKGLKVLDFCWVAVSPMTTVHLAECGATVIRIESTRRPNLLRRSPRWGGRTLAYAHYNANKTNLAVSMAPFPGADVHPAAGRMGGPCD